MVSDDGAIHGFDIKLQVGTVRPVRIDPKKNIANNSSPKLLYQCFVEAFITICNATLPRSNHSQSNTFTNSPFFYTIELYTGIGICYSCLLSRCRNNETNESNQSFLPYLSHLCAAKMF